MDTAKRILLLLAVLLAVPAVLQAQEAVLTGTVTDATNAVLPGVAVTAVNTQTGNKFETVTGESGAYRLAVRVGDYVITAQLPGFTTVERAGVQLLVGQAVTINLQMSPSAVQETVTVTGESPLIEVTPRRSAATSTRGKCRSCR